MRGLKDKILSRGRGRGPGSVHISKDFLDLGSRAAIDQTLSRLVKEGTLRRLGRGLFDLPRTNPRLKVVMSPDPEQVAQALARKRGGRVRRSGAFAANALGLSTQVPAKQVYLTDGSPTTLRLGKQTLTFKQVAPGRVAARDSVTSSVLEALHYIGKDGLTDGIVDRLRATLTPADKKRLLSQSRYAVGWIADAVKKVVKEKVDFPTKNEHRVNGYPARSYSTGDR